MIQVTTDSEHERDLFIRRFIVNFISTYNANNYDDYCFRGDALKLYDSPPLEDVYSLAEEHWIRIQEFENGL